jgi:hypothetical protein
MVGLIEFGFPALLLVAVLLIAGATLLLHSLFPPTHNTDFVKKKNDSTQKSRPRIENGG